MTVRSRRLALVAVSLVGVIHVPPTAAQDTQVGFLHGLFSDSTTWQYGAGVLANSNRLIPIRPTTDWRQYLTGQAANLSLRLSTTGVPAIGHSNGGLVARQYVLTYGASSKLNRLITIGTPHQGAPIITNAKNGTASGLLLQIPNLIGNAIGFYTSYDPSLAGPGFGHTFLRLLGDALTYMSALLQLAPQILQVAGVPMQDLQAPITTKPRAQQRSQFDDRAEPLDCARWYFYQCPNIRNVAAPGVGRTRDLDRNPVRCSVRPLGALQLLRSAPRSPSSKQRVALGCRV